MQITPITRRKSQADVPVFAPLASRPLGIWDSFATARRNVLELIPAASLHLPILSGKSVGRWHMVTDPTANRRILKEAPDDYPKSSVTKDILRPAIGESLFVAEGEHWRWQRKLAAPVFTHRNVAALGPVMTAAAERAADRIAASRGRAADMLTEMVQATYEVISDVTFSGKDGFDRDALNRAIEAYLDDAAKVSILDILAVPTWVPRLSRERAKRLLAGPKASADGLIEARKRDGARPVPDLLDLLLAGGDGSDRQMTTQELRDNLLTFILAGHETTALTLAWALYLCAFDPAVQEAARDEAAGVLGQGPAARPATAEDVAKLPYTRQIIDEALRLYPPGGFMSRTAKAPDVLAGHEVQPGDTVSLPVYALHRNHRLWEDPARFRPQRFADRAAIDRYAYLPFGDGPRICIGASFAIQEAVIILATLLARFRFTAVPGRVPKPVMIVTLRPEGGVWLEVQDA